MAEEYLKYLYSKEGQEIIAQNYYRPRDPQVAAKYANVFPKLTLTTIKDFGGWSKAQQTHFCRGRGVRSAHAAVPGARSTPRQWPEQSCKE